MPKNNRKFLKALKNFMRTPLMKGRRIILVVLTVLVLSLMVSVRFLPHKVGLKLGDVSDEDIIAGRAVRYLDVAETERLRQQAVEKVQKEYDVRGDAQSSAVKMVDDIYNKIYKVCTDDSLISVGQKVAKLRQELGVRLSDHILYSAVGLEVVVIEQLRKFTRQVVKQVMSQEIKDDTDDLRQAFKQANDLSKKLPLQEKYISIISQVALNAIRPNRIFNEERTQRRINEAMRSVQPVYKEVLAGDMIIHKGERVSEKHLAKFEALGLKSPTVNYATIIALVLLVMVLVGIVVFYLHGFKFQIYADDKCLFLLSLITILAVVIFWFGSPLSGYVGMLAVATAGMLVCILIDFHLAILVVGVLSLLVGIVMNYDLKIVIASLVSGLASVLVASKVSYRKDLMIAGFVISGVNMMVISILCMLSGEPLLSNVLKWGVGNGVLTAVLTLGLMTFLEKPFRITTHMWLLELLNPNEPLLRRLATEAPGTYHHSIVVANLVQAAAERMGADALLARVGAFYHDVGKIKRPYLFVENQINLENIHEKLNPALSALAVGAHAKEGAELAQEYNLPREITDFIAQHHGTSSISFFGQQMKDEKNNLEQRFRYAGPKPQSKEVALVMLADAVEAAVRSLKKPSPSRIEELVDKIVESKLKDGQLDECDIHLKDLDKIKDAFVYVLTSMFHPRIEYPEVPPEGGKRSGGNTGKGPAKSAGKEEDAAGSS